MNTAERTFLDLCEEVDHWKREAKTWEARYKDLSEQYSESLNQSIKGNKEMVGIMLNAVLDPESVINKGHEAKLREQMGEQKS